MPFTALGISSSWCHPQRTALGFPAIHGWNPWNHEVDDGPKLSPAVNHDMFDEMEVGCLSAGSKGPQPLKMLLAIRCSWSMASVEKALPRHIEIHKISGRYLQVGIHRRFEPIRYKNHQKAHWTGRLDCPVRSLVSNLNPVVNCRHRGIPRSDDPGLEIPEEEHLQSRLQEALFLAVLENVTMKTCSILLRGWPFFMPTSFLGQVARAIDT